MNHEDAVAAAPGGRQVISVVEPPTPPYRTVKPCHLRSRIFTVVSPYHVFFSLGRFIRPLSCFRSPRVLRLPICDPISSSREFAVHEILFFLLIFPLNRHHVFQVSFSLLYILHFLNVLDYCYFSSIIHDCFSIARQNDRRPALVVSAILPEQSIRAL